MIDLDKIKVEERELYEDLEKSFGKILAQMVFHSKFQTRELAYIQVSEEFEKEKSELKLKTPEEVVVRCL